MTLFKQLALLTSFFLGVVLVTVLILNFRSSQAFIQDQLLSNAEDTAASLALSLGSAVNDTPLNKSDDGMGLDALDDLEAPTSSLKGQDVSKILKSTLEVMVNAIYDRGYYESIVLEDHSGKALIAREQKVSVADIPAWFINTVTLNVASATSEVSGAYGSKFGKIIVKSHVGNGYVQLWDIFINLIQTFVVLAVLFFVALSFLLRIILRSLSDIEKQAKAIQDHDFIIYDKVPFTSEFRHVVGAMNQMVGKVKEIFDKEAQSLKKYHELLYTDTETKLYNRRFLSMKLDTYLAEGSNTPNGTFVMLTLDGLEEAKKRFGYQKMQLITLKIASHLTQASSVAQEGLAVRMNEKDLALLIPSSNVQECQSTLESMMAKIKEDFIALDIATVLRLSAGVVNYKQEDTPKTLFARADFELSKAKIQQSSTIAFAKKDDTNTLVLGKEEWTSMINASLEENMLKVAGQDVIDIATKESLHKEVYLRMVDEKGTVYNAGYFMPVLINLDLTDAVDKHVLELSLYHAKNRTDITSLAINISAPFLAQPDNFHWLREKILEFSKQSKVVLSFEASNFNVLKNIELFTQFAYMLKPRSYQFGIDNFTLTKEGLDYLQSIKPSYIKANKSFYFDLQEDSNSSANESLRILASSLGIKMIATAVESEQELERLKEIKLQYVQGSIIEEPKILGA